MCRKKKKVHNDNLGTPEREGVGFVIRLLNPNKGEYALTQKVEVREIAPAVYRRRKITSKKSNGMRVKPSPFDQIDPVRDVPPLIPVRPV